MITLPETTCIRRWAQPIFGALLSATLAACGGSGHNHSGLLLSGTPTAAATVSEGSTASSSTSAPTAAVTAPRTPPSAATIPDQIAALERSGAYPAPDRSTDIAGPDANKNGVRDDIEAWINSLRLNDAQKKALMQDARATQQTMLVDLSDKNALQRADEGLMASMKCGGDSFPKRSDFYPLAQKIEAMTANTFQRAKRYMKYNVARSGSSTSYPEGNTCEP